MENQDPKTPASLPIGDESAARAMQLVQAAMVAKLLHGIVQLGVPDALASGPLTVPELATKLGANEDALVRALRALEVHGVFVRAGDGRWDVGELGRALQSHVPGNVRNYVAYALHDGNWRAWAKVEDVLKSGQPVFADVNDGLTPFQYMTEHARIGEAFQVAMVSRAVHTARMVVEALDLAKYGVIAEIGGGLGVLLAEILEALPDARGVLFETDLAASHARGYLEERGLASRVRIDAGDFFVDFPKDADAYILKNILHDWADREAGKILDVCRSSMKPGARLFVVDYALSDDPTPHPGKLLDLQMMVVLGGRERSTSEWHALLARHGFRVERITAATSGEHVIEAVPA
ncbi:hypothetical protein L6R52_20055 [Myxococcota bacterium]|nr:hypothetical protein [Myxococcota bacterium]